MPMVILVVQDTDNGAINVKMQMEPATPASTSDFTPAQRLAAVALNAIEGAMADGTVFQQS